MTGQAVEDWGSGVRPAGAPQQHTQRLLLVLPTEPEYN